MSFTSGAPRNTDPHPWALGDGYGPDTAGTRIKRSSVGWTGMGDYFDPRPEFDLPPRDDVNPILSAYRRHTGPDTASEFFEWAFLAFDAFGGWMAWEDASHPAHSFTTATPAQVEHAWAVLSRLRRLTY